MYEYIAQNTTHIVDEWRERGVQGAGQRASDVGARGDLLIADRVPSVQRADRSEERGEAQDHYLHA